MPTSIIFIEIYCFQLEQCLSKKVTFQKIIYITKTCEHPSHFSFWKKKKNFVKSILLSQLPGLTTFKN